MKWTLQHFTTVHVAYCKVCAHERSLEGLQSYVYIYFYVIYVTYLHIHVDVFPEQDPIDLGKILQTIQRIDCLVPQRDSVVADRT